MRRIYESYDPVTCTRSYVDYDESEDALHFTEECDVTALMEWNKRLYNEASDHWGDGAIVSKMPAMLRTKLQREGVTNDRRLWRKWLNDPDYRGFRIRPGRV